MKQITPEELFAAGVHIGHKRQKIHAKSRKYIHVFNKGVSIIDLVQTAQLLQNASQFVSNLAKENKEILVVGTKRQAKPILEKYTSINGLYFLIAKWIPGFLTNFSEIKKNLQKMNRMKEEQANGSWDKYPKHEIAKLSKKLARMIHVYGFVHNLAKLPDAVFIIDAKKEINAIKEARSMNIPIIAITDTNSNPSLVDYPIPANDDAASSLEVVINAILGAYADQKK